MTSQDDRYQPKIHFAKVLIVAVKEQREQGFEDELFGAQKAAEFLGPKCYDMLNDPNPKQLSTHIRGFIGTEDELSYYSAVIVYLLAYGNDDNGHQIVLSDDEPYDFSRFYGLFSYRQAAHHANRSKLFFVQACQRGEDMRVWLIDSMPRATTYPTDLFICYATCTNSKALRGLFRTLHEVLEKEPRPIGKDITSINQSVKRTLRKHRQSCEVIMYLPGSIILGELMLQYSKAEEEIAEDLQGVTLGALNKIAVTEGLANEQIQDTDEAPNPIQWLKDLIMHAHEAKDELRKKQQEEVESKQIARGEGRDYAKAQVQIVQIEDLTNPEQRLRGEMAKWLHYATTRDAEVKATLTRYSRRQRRSRFLRRSAMQV